LELSKIPTFQKPHGKTKTHFSFYFFQEALIVSAYRQCKCAYSDYIPDINSSAVSQKLGDDYHTYHISYWTLNKSTVIEPWWWSEDCDRNMLGFNF